MIDELELREWAARRPHAWRATTATTLNDRFNALKRFYALAMPAMRRTPKHEWATEIYEIDWVSLFSPIEAALWDDIRAEGVVLYPQFPVAGYFVDFGHPIARVAVECDGFAYHQNHERDRRRQERIEAEGWTVYRIGGADCFTGMREEEDMDTGHTKLVVGPARQFITQIAARHRLSPKYLRLEST